MYLLLLLDVTGKRLVLLLNTFPFTSVIFIVAIFARTSSLGGDVCIVFVGELMFRLENLFLLFLQRDHGKKKETWEVFGLIFPCLLLLI